MKKKYNHPTIESVEICLATGICSAGMGNGGYSPVDVPPPSPGTDL